MNETKYLYRLFGKSSPTSRRTYGRLLDDLHRLVDAVEAIDLHNPPRGRQAVVALNRLELARSDVNHHLAFLIDWMSSPRQCAGTLGVLPGWGVGLVAPCVVCGEGTASRDPDGRPCHSRHAHEGGHP